MARRDVMAGLLGRRLSERRRDSLSWPSPARLARTKETSGVSRSEGPRVAYSREDAEGGRGTAPAHLRGAAAGGGAAMTAFIFASFTALFVTVNPIKGAAVFAVLSKSRSRPQQR